MHFNWQRFCETQRIPFVTRGPNTARNHISVKCPFCGNQDPSEHMGLHLVPTEPKWGCLRNPAHRGRHPVRLIRALLRCSEERARSLLESMAPELDAFDAVASELLVKSNVTTAPVHKPQRRLKLLPDMKPLKDSGYGKRFMDYLQDRGFNDAEGVAFEYSLHYTLVGPFAWRLILPLWNGADLVGWTGRTIRKDEELRYLTLPSSPAPWSMRHNLPLALTDPEEYVMDQDIVLMGNKALVVCEGPLDWLKLDWYKPSQEITVTCLFGMPKQRQMELLAVAARRYQRIAIVLDPDAFAQATQLSYQLSELSGRDVLPLTIDDEDPGAMSRRAVRDLLQRLI